MATAKDTANESSPAELLAPLRDDFEKKSAPKITRDLRMAEETLAVRREKYDAMIAMMSGVFHVEDSYIEDSEHLNPAKISPRGDKTWEEIREDLRKTD